MSLESRSAQMGQGAQDVHKVVSDALGEDLHVLSLVSLEMSEAPAERTASIRSKLLHRNGRDDNVIEVHGEGVGLLDAFITAVSHHFEPPFASLSGVSVADFSLKGVFQDGDVRRSAAGAEASVRLSNSEGHVYEFARRTPSMSHSAAQAILDGFAFFINAEVAYKRLRRALKDAQERRRQDLVDRYTHALGVVVRATSYAKIAKDLESGT